jgi:hypothetical protein
MIRNDTLIQCASYALELLSNWQPTEPALLTDDLLELLYYDRSKLIISDQSASCTTL